METELKTLKDLEIDEDDWEEEDNIPKSKLKAEAVKWVKGYKKDIINHDGQIEWIKHFFNLTSEDLK